MQLHLNILGLRKKSHFYSPYVINKQSKTEWHYNFGQFLNQDLSIPRPNCSVSNLYLKLFFHAIANNVPPPPLSVFTGMLH